MLLEISGETTISALLTMPKPLTVWITINWKILKVMGIPDHMTCLLRNLYAGQEGRQEEIPLIQGKEQRLCFAGAAVKRYPTPKVRGTQVKW